MVITMDQSQKEIEEVYKRSKQLQKKRTVSDILAQESDEDESKTNATNNTENNSDEVDTMSINEAENADDAYSDSNSESDSDSSSSSSSSGKMETSSSSDDNSGAEVMDIVSKANNPSAPPPMTLRFE